MSETVHYTVILEHEDDGGYHMHTGLALNPKTLAGIVSDMRLTMDEFRRRL